MRNKTCGMIKIIICYIIHQIILAYAELKLIFSLTRGHRYTHVKKLKDNYRA